MVTVQTVTDSAFGAPGIPPTFAPGDKDAVATALGSSRVWLTVGGGVLNEVFWPTTGRPQLRDLGFLVTGTGYWTEVKRVGDYTIELPDPAVPLPTIHHHHERYELTLDIVCDPGRDAVMVSYHLRDLTPGGDPELALHLLAAPHLGGSGWDNSAWIDGPILLAAKENEALAIMADPPFASASAGYVGASDGWQDVAQHGRPQWRFVEARSGNVALTATCGALAGSIALAFATTARGARSLADAALIEGFAQLEEAFRIGWLDWAAALPFGPSVGPLKDLARASAMVIRVHEDLTFPGAMVASLATPWGAAHDDPGGYHLVWPRDCAESALALAAIGLRRDALRTLRFLASTQSADGHWPQNFSPDGTAYWNGIQLDEAALPVILAAKLHELDLLTGRPHRVVEMVGRACAYIAVNGPLSQQDRWEEAAGVNPFSMAAAITALAAAALSGLLEPPEAVYALSLADWWNSRVEALLYVEGTSLDQARGVAGHYVRIAPDGVDPKGAKVMLANRGGELFPADELVGLEFLALVRYGLRRPDDPCIVNTVAVVDAELRVETPAGPLYHRYQHDGYGEHDDGSPFDGGGIGRLWPLLAGERGAYAVAAGADADPYLQALLGSASQGRLLPEQVWDAAAIPDKRLFPGRPTGSAAPLVWAHAEFLKLYLAAVHGVNADQVASVAQHFQPAPAPATAHLRHEAVVATAAAVIAIEADHPFRLRWRREPPATDGTAVGGVGDAPREQASEPGPFGLHAVRLARADLGSAGSVVWTRLGSDGNPDGPDHRIDLM